MAWHQFHCDYCIAPIEPGDSYEREVYANHSHLWVKRRHYPDCLGPTEEEWIEENERIRRELEEEEQQEQEVMGKIA